MGGVKKLFCKICGVACRHKRAVGIVAAVLAFFLVMGLIPVILWPDEAKTLTLEWLKFAAYVVGGGLVLRQLQISNRRATALENTASLGEKGNITERFKNAIEHLANKSESVQIGGIYALYHVAREAEEYKDAVLKIILAHLRKITAGKDEPINEVVKAILDVLFVPINQTPLFKEVNLSGVNLQGIEWDSALGSTFGGIRRRVDTIVSAVGLDLSGGIFIRADLRGAKLIGAILNGTRFQYANLSECILIGVQTCEGANFSRATCVGINFEGTSGVNFERARFTDADLTNADFHESGIDARQLLDAKTLYLAELPDHIREPIMKKKPQLFDKPK